MATDPSMIRAPALRARLIVKERIVLRSAGVSPVRFAVDMAYRFKLLILCAPPFYSIRSTIRK